MAALVNVIIDDTRGDERSGAAPEYSSAHAWNARSADDQCSICGAQPDPGQPYDHTWHDDTTFPGQLPSNITFSFKGTALSIFFILANNVDIVHKDTRLAFYLDGSPKPVTQYLHTPDLTVNGFLYNQPVFANASLPDGEHTILISSRADGDHGSLALFDYAIYTTAPHSGNVTTSPTRPTNSLPATGATAVPGKVESSEKSNVGGIIAGCVTGAAAALVLLLGLFWLWRRRSTREQSLKTEVTAYHVPGGRLVEQQSSEKIHAGEDAQSASTAPSTGISLQFSHPPQPPVSPGDESLFLRSELVRVTQELERLRESGEPLPSYSHPIS